jgi:general secretion pathway protein J
LEVLVALFITAILTSLGTSLVLTTLSGEQRFEKVADEARAIELLHATLQTDLTQLSARVVRAPDGQPRPWIFSGGQATIDGPLIAFSRAGWDNPGGAEPRGSIIYVEYVLQDDRLVRRSWTRLDPTTETPKLERTLLTGIERAEASFGDGVSWFPTFAAGPDDAQSGFFPSLVALDLDVKGAGQIRQVFATGLGR